MNVSIGTDFVAGFVVGIFLLRLAQFAFYAFSRQPSTSPPSFLIGEGIRRVQRDLDDEPLSDEVYDRDTSISYALGRKAVYVYVRRQNRVVPIVWPEWTP